MKSISRMTFLLSIVVITLISCLTTSSSSLLWHVIRFSAYFRLVDVLSTRSIILKPLQSQFMSTSGQKINSKSRTHPWAIFSSTWYLTPLMVRFSLEHTQPILNSMASPILFIVSLLSRYLFSRIAHRFRFRFVYIRRSHCTVYLARYFNRFSFAIVLMFPRV